MTLVRERRHRQPLSLSLPPPLPAIHLPSLSARSPGIENISDLEKLAVLGHGNGGTVYKVCHKRTNSIFALKVLRFDRNSTVIRQQAAHEAAILKRVDSSYIVRCYAVFDTEDDLCFAMELMDGGSLHDKLLARKVMPEEMISGMARSVLKGLQYLHSMKIVHGDIKPSNLLINSQGEIKIADFGVSRVVTMNNTNNYMGTCAYMSPERFDFHGDNWEGDGGDGFSGDVWSLGVVVLECFVGYYPLIGVGEKPEWAALVCAICFGESLELPENMSMEFRSFVGRCLEKDWRKRGTVNELLLHPFILGKSASVVCSNEL